jgi:putative PIN family toxin of toxin-antitoxin system
MIRVVIDTNVLVSGIYNLSGNSGKVLRLVLEKNISVCFDARILHEYRFVCARPEFNFNMTMVDEFLEFLVHHGTAIVPTVARYDHKDPKDAAFYEVAASALPDFLITGNLRHFPAHIGKTRVVNPADFIKWYLSAEKPED